MLSNRNMATGWVSLPRAVNWIRVSLLAALAANVGCHTMPRFAINEAVLARAASEQPEKARSAASQTAKTPPAVTSRISDAADEAPQDQTQQGASVVPVSYEAPSDTLPSDTSPSDLVVQPATVVPASAFAGHRPRATACGQCGTDCGGACSSTSSGGVACGTLECVGCGTCSMPAPSLPNAQEYIFDGGDQPPRVLVRKDWSAAGVDPSDTVIYYETLGGQVCVTPSNRVPIYAPRFGAVRQVTGLELAQRAVGTERFLAPITPIGMHETNGAGNLSLPLAPHGELQVNMLDAFQEERGGVPIAGVLPPQRMSEAVGPVERLIFFTTGEMLDEEIPVLGRILANAREWYTPESVQVEIQGQVAALVVDSKRAQDVFVYEMPDKCAMRICKAASHNIANSGDIIRFTIRFDNVGPKPLGNAVVMDSLVPRLEYIEDSQQCSVPCIFTATPNEVGSQVLRWEIEEPVAPGEGGVISFACRVR